MRIFGAAILAIALAGCATSTPVPSMRPMSQDYINSVGPTAVDISENNNGVEKSWFFTSTQSAGAAYGLIGALVSGVMDAIINAGPSYRAHKAADEMSRLISVDDLNSSLATHFRAQMPTAGATPQAGVSFETVSTEQRVNVRGGAPNDAILVTTSYTLSEDASTLRVIAFASYRSDQTPYHTPYTFKGSVPRDQTTGPAYSNTFTYYSTQLPIPTLTPELQDRLVASIENSAREANGGELPAENSNEWKSMMREETNARDNNLTKDEIAIFLTREWLKDNGALLRHEVDLAHDFIARYVLLDMNRATVPTIDGQDELLETTADERTVRRIGGGSAAGSYVSSAGNVTSFASYGNVTAISQSNSDRINSIRSSGRRGTAAAPAH
ncbi:MAG: hypothetical protein QM759_02840 [Terricaulis sp.]